MNKLVINAKDFVLGASETDAYQNKGYSPDDKGANINYIKGLLSPSMSLTAKAGTVYKPIAVTQSVETSDPVLLGTNTTNDDGYVYQFNDVSSEGTQKLTDSTKNYQFGVSDIVYYKGNYYATSTTDVALINSALDSITANWWTNTLSLTALNSSYPHPMLIFDDVLYIADGNLIHIYNGSAGTHTYHTLPTGSIISAWVIHNNKIYIAVRGQLPKKVYIWDGTSPQYEDQFTTREQVYSMYVYNGQLLLFLETTVSRWTGVSLDPIFRGYNTVYKHQIMQYQDLLYFTYGQHLVCWDGEYISYPYSTANGALSSYTINFLHCSYYVWMTININNTNYNTSKGSSDGVGYWRGNRYEFGQNCYIRKLVVELYTPLASGSEIEFYFYDHNGISQTIGTMTYASDGAVSIKEFNNINIKTYSIQPRVYFKANGKSIRQLTIYYEPTEQPARKS